MFYLPNPEVLHHLGVVASGTPQDQVYHQWMNTMQQYSTPIGSHEPTCDFWVVVRMVGSSYSKHLMDHPTLPMMMPASGTGDLVGLARTKEELDDMITPQIDPKTGEIKKGDFRGDYVYLTYKVKLRGEDGWRGLLDYLGQTGMLEKDC